MPAKQSVRSQLAGLTIDELRDTLLALRGSSAPLARKRSDLIDAALAAGVGDRKVEEVAARVETLSPRKHLWIFALSGVESGAFDDLAREAVSKKARGAGFRTLDELDDGSDKLQLRLILFEESESRLYAKYEHWLTSESWKKTGPKTKVLVTDRIRHSVTTAIRPQEGVLEVRFDGYTQGLATPQDERFPYTRVAHQAACLTSELVGATTTGMSLAAAVERLIDSQPDEIKDIKRNVRPSGGGSMTFDAGEEDPKLDVAGYVTEFFSKGSSSQLIPTRDQIRTALRSWPAESVLLHWVRYDLLTRITNHDIGPEILFVWRTAPRDPWVAQTVLNTLLREHRAVGTVSQKNLVSHLASLAEATTVRLSDLMSQFNVSGETASEALQRAVKLGVIHPVFRVRTQETIHNFPNLWRHSLTEFPTEIATESGQSISLTDPANIEIGYRRAGPPAA